jgi:hypothetical protein
MIRIIKTVWSWWHNHRLARREIRHPTAHPDKRLLIFMFGERCGKIVYDIQKIGRGEIL